MAEHGIDLTDTIEAGAKALWQRNYSPGGLSWDEAEPSMHAIYLHDAEAVIRAALPHLHYWSTACQHGHCDGDECREVCKYGDGEMCKCLCHSTKDTKEPAA